jgi:hypothetical protein
VLEVFEQSGHFPHLTEPDRLARVLGEWLERTAPVQLDPADLTERLRNPTGAPHDAHAVDPAAVR